MKIIMENWRRFLVEQLEDDDCPEGQEYDPETDDCAPIEVEDGDLVDIAKIARKKPKKKPKKKSKKSTSEPAKITATTIDPPGTVYEQNYPTVGGKYFLEPIEGYIRVGSTFGKGSKSRLKVRAGVGSENHGAIDQFAAFGSPIRASALKGKVVSIYSTRAFDSKSVNLAKYLADEEDFIYNGAQFDPRNKAVKQQERYFGKSMKKMKKAERAKLKTKPNIFFKSGKDTLSKEEKEELRNVKNWSDLREACAKIFNKNMIAQLIRVKKSTIRRRTGFHAAGPYVEVEYTSDQGDKFNFRYLHLSQVEVSKKGSFEDKENLIKIGEVGNGASFDTPKHLHLEVQKNGTRVDPQKYIPALDPNRKIKTPVAQPRTPTEPVVVPGPGSK
tara:strand:- start:2729 stop:3886 length:1158 start_codon:yes stop_codon:yes gene_type:complete